MGTRFAAEGARCPGRDRTPLPREVKRHFPSLISLMGFTLIASNTQSIEVHRRVTRRILQTKSVAVAAPVYKTCDGSSVKPCLTHALLQKAISFPPLASNFAPHSKLRFLSNRLFLSRRRNSGEGGFWLTVVLRVNRAVRFSLQPPFHGVSL